MESHSLNEQLEKAQMTVKNFNDRETIFGLPNTMYPDLDEIQRNFKPFNDLI